VDQRGGPERLRTSSYASLSGTVYSLVAVSLVMAVTRGLPPDVDASAVRGRVLDNAEQQLRRLEQEQLRHLGLGGMVWCLAP
jgi:hypothetical protein